jgi:HindIII restriction endonuclease
VNGLSRTAKNQKDFKVQAMDNWKHGKPFATVVCPAYQLPSRTSQIYQQAASRSVLVSTYTHLAVGIRYADIAGMDKAIDLLHTVFRAVEALNPSKSAVAYWQAVNMSILGFDKTISALWREEKIALTESITVSKQEAFRFLARERERIMRLSREEAINEVLKLRKLDNRIKAINKVSDNGILNAR